MAQLAHFLDSFGISEWTLQAVLVGALVLATALLVVSGLSRSQRRRRLDQRQAEFSRLQRL